jgi:hypothetical protein
MAVTNNGRVIIFGAAADALTDEMHIQKMRWVGYTAATDTLSVTNTADAVYVASAGDANLTDVDIELHGISMLGIKVATMTSGTLYVYLGGGQY